MKTQLLYSTICFLPTRISFPEMRECCIDVDVTYDRLEANRVFRFYGEKVSDLEHIINVLELKEIY